MRRSSSSGRAVNGWPRRSQDVRRSVDAIAEDLFEAEDKARLAAEAAGREAAERPDDGTPEELAALLLAEEAVGERPRHWSRARSEVGDDRDPGDGRAVPGGGWPVTGRGPVRQDPGCPRGGAGRGAGRRA